MRCVGFGRRVVRRASYSLRPRCFRRVANAMIDATSVRITNDTCRNTGSSTSTRVSSSDGVRVRTDRRSSRIGYGGNRRKPTKHSCWMCAPILPTFTAPRAALTSAMSGGIDMPLDIMKITAALNAYPWTSGALSMRDGESASYCAVGLLLRFAGVPQAEIEGACSAHVVLDRYRELL